MPVGGSGWSRGGVCGALQLLGPSYRGCCDAEGLCGPNARADDDGSQYRVADNHGSYRNGMGSLFFFSGVKMIYSEISMIVEFLCYHRGRGMERGYTKKKMDK